MKKKIKQRLNFEFHELEGTLQDAVDTLSSYLQFPDVIIEIDYDYDDCRLAMFAMVEETDEQYAKRLTKEKKEKERKQQEKEKRKQLILKEAKKLGLKVTE